MAVPRIPRCCLACGAQMQVRAKVIAAGNGKYCSNLCRYAGAKSHGESSESRVSVKTPEYKAWKCMKARCFCRSGPDYADYGGRGITVCDKWRNSFPAFLADVGRKPTTAHTLDRWPDRNGGYHPGNVRWATQAEQQRNRRDTVLLTHGGETRCMREWERLLGMGSGTLKNRLKRGWSVDRTLTTPVDHRRRRKA